MNTETFNHLESNLVIIKGNVYYGKCPIMNLYFQQLENGDFIWKSKEDMEEVCTGEYILSNTTFQSLIDEQIEPKVPPSWEYDS